MSSSLRTGFFAVALMFVFGAIAVTETNAQINEILKRMDTHYKALQTLRADIKMVKYDVNWGTDDSDVYVGKLIYLPAKGRDAYVRIDWSKPEESFSVVDKKYVIYRPRRRQLPETLTMPKEARARIIRCRLSICQKSNSKLISI